MFVKVKSAGLWGVEGFLVEVEVDLSAGLPTFQLVGLPDSSVKEARERVRSAVKNAGFPFPQKRITVNLSPSHLKKQGTHYDLPIALGILSASGLLKLPEGYAFLGELSLSGELKKPQGLLPLLLALKEAGVKKAVVPEEGKEEASLVRGLTLYPCSSLGEAVSFLKGEKEVAPLKPAGGEGEEEEGEEPLEEVLGQRLAKRALEVCAAGFHHLLLVGPPGVGKSLLARKVASLAPYLEEDEALEVAKVYSVAGLLKGRLPKRRPLQSPHHTASEVALVGGGNPPAPGLVSLAHRGFLLLDEMPEFPRKVLESLRQPLEEGKVTVSRAGYTFTFPAQFTLVATANPCPCGNYRNPYKACRCSEREVRAYRARVSEPVRERIDLKVWMGVPKEEVFKEENETPYGVKERIEKAFRIQKERGELNGKLSPSQVRRFCEELMSKEAKSLAEAFFKDSPASLRNYHKLLKVSRTLADLEESEKIEDYHVAEALQLTAEPF